MRSSRRAIGIAAVIVVAWIAAAGFLGPVSGKLSEVQTNDAASFLPAKAEATRAQEIAARFAGGGSTPAVVVYERRDGLTAEDIAAVRADAQRFGDVSGVVGQVSPPIPSEDRAALQIVVPVTNDALKSRITIDELRRIAAQGAPAGLATHVTGPAGLRADLVEVFAAIDVQLLLVTAGVVLLILLVVYRSPVLWIIPMLSVGIAYTAAASAAYLLADQGIVKLNGQAQGILTVLVFGAGTDYALLIIARYREELRHTERPSAAMAAALRGATPAVVASGLTVAASLLCLLLSDLNSNKALGPIAAAGIVATLVVMLTLLPALLVLGGRWAFWPRIPHFGATGSSHPAWDRIAGTVGRHARTTWVVSGLVLVGCAVGLTQLEAAGIPQTAAFTTAPDSVAGQQAIGRHYPAGSGSPATVVVPAANAEQAATAARDVAGVSDVVPYTGGAPVGPPKEVDGYVRIDVTLRDAPDSAAAERTVIDLREAVHPSGALVGGFTATQLDTRTASTHDSKLIIPVVLVVITVILALLLRAIVAPLLLVATVVLSFAATLGICAVLFREVFGFAGQDASFPLFAFVFLVALGVDYNIFLMTRVREESVRHGTRRGVLTGLAVTGGVITSAGVVLAATFSALAVLPLVVLVELGVAVALGVLIDTVIVRSLLVPGLTYELSDRVWWPARPARNVAGRPAHTDPPA